ncbi:hypothetical protein D7Y42_12280 [Stenotrophomonas maltophilia]|nr:hypothetical protein [Stenotrophomonas maltophilia]MBA0376534.1 hypothetical protein [Stenotrophomonas maltophilia]MBA0546088.1 hypothetical protein [Stenotrophomonas maltophilia]PWI04121.1 hypothetical protein DI494_02135 [Stenotrophomonas maltophilia]
MIVAGQAESCIHLAHCDRPLGDPASQKAVENALLLFRLANPATEDLAAMHARGEQPSAIGFDDAGALVQRGEDGQLHPYHLQE